MSICMYCKMDTGGNHEANCPLANPGPGVQEVQEMMEIRSTFGWSADRRVSNDPVFHRLFHYLYEGMRQHQFTPTDVREALLQASVEIQRHRLGPYLVEGKLSYFHDMRPEVDDEQG